MKISIVGFGYIGAVIGAVYAELGHSVHAIDSNVSSMNDLNQGMCHVPEPALRELIAKGVENKNLSGSTSYDSVLGSDVVLVTVGTPLSDEFDADLSAIRDVFKKLSGYVSDGQIIMVKSTVPPGVTRQMADEFLANRENVFIGFSPERLAEGNAIQEFRTLPIVVGGINEKSTERCADFWSTSLGVEVIKVSSCESAELVKLANNQWIDLNIALANELAILCDSLPYDLDILEIIQGANSLKKGQHYVNILTPSIGVGGYCLTKDPWFLSALGSQHGAAITLPQTGRYANDKMPGYSADSIQQHFNRNHRQLSSLKVAILGYSFKSNSGDVRFSPMEKFVEQLFDRGVLDISVFDSTISDTAINDSRVFRSTTWVECIKDADCVVFGAGHDDLCQISMEEIAKFMARNGLLYDGRRFLTKTHILELQNLGVAYQGVGRSFS
jgi:nucleotide sugar dehydrogenase